MSYDGHTKDGLRLGFRQSPNDTADERYSLWKRKVLYISKNISLLCNEVELEWSKKICCEGFYHMLDILRTKRDKKDIAVRREEISRLLMQSSPNMSNGTISALSVADLQLLFQLYDRIFFQGWFKEHFKGKLKFSLSRRMTRSAGLTLCPKNIDKIKPEQLIIEIRIGVDLFFQYGVVEGSKTVCGIDTCDSLKALQLVFEHELCHVLEFIYFKKSSCKQERFKTMANNLFGHTESYHKLPTNRQIANQKLGLNIGDTVSFTFEGKTLTGILYNINKRATVMVRNNRGTLVDNRGNRYSKYYVPLTLLK